MFDSFDYVRIKRNALQYYGKSMEQEVARDAFQKSRILINQILEILNKEAI